MQSSNDFGIGATVSVNGHGWPVPYGPIGDTIRSFRLMLASGDVVSCSPVENPELFALVIGGYGLFGVIVDLDLAMVENQPLRSNFAVLPAAEFGPRFDALLTQDPTVRLAYGRLSVHRKMFLREALLVSYRPVAGAPGPLASGGLMTAVSREVFRAQIGSEVAKQTRWRLETTIGAKSTTMSRNTLLNDPVAAIAGRDRSRTDILHEYFLPPRALEPFLEACRDIIPKSRQELLNVTLRYVGADRRSVLAYAPEPRVAAVMLFSQAMTQSAEADMRAMTEWLIDVALELGGSFYLPYRLHARADQRERAYSRLTEFAARKRQYDPSLLFRNLMWDAYFAV